MMKQLIEAQKKVQSQWEREFFSALKEQVEHYKKWFHHVMNAHDEFLQILSEDSPVFQKAWKKSKEPISESINTYLTLIDAHFEKQIASCCEQIILAQDEIISFQQPEERFSPLDSDSTWIKFGKSVKRWDRRLRLLALSSGNWLRKLFKKPIKSMQAREQHVPFRLILSNRIRPFAVEQIKLLNHTSYRFFSESLRLFLSSLNAWALAELDKKQVLVSQQRDKLEQLRQRADQAWEDFLQQSERTFTEELARVLHDAEIAGTFEYSIKATDQDSGKKVMQDFLDELPKRKKSWEKEWRAQLDYLKQIDELEELNKSLISEYEALKHGINRALEENYSKLWQKFSSKVELLNDRVEAHVGKKSNTSFIKELQKTVKESTEFLTKSILPKLEPAFFNSLIQPKIEAYESAFDRFIQQLSDQVIVITEFDNEAYPPKLETKKLDWATLINRILMDGHLRFVLALPEKIRAQLVQVNETLHSISEIIEVNLNASTDALMMPQDHEMPEKLDGNEEKSSSEEQFQNAIETASSALDRVVMLVKQIIDQHQSQINAIWKALEKQLGEVSNYLQTKLHNHELADLEYRRRELQVRSTALDWKTKLEIYWAKTEDKLVLYSRFAFKKGSEYYDIIKKFLFPEAKANKKSSRLLLGEYVRELNKKLDELPFIYQKLFSLQHKTDLRHFTGFATEIGVFNKAYQAWKSGLNRTVAIIGEAGSGKSLFIQKAIKDTNASEKVTTIAFKHSILSSCDLLSYFNTSLKLNAADFKELADLLKKKPKQCIVLDPLDNTFLRVVNGFDVINEILLLIMATSKQVFWIVSIGRYTWDYLDKVVHLSKFFTVELSTDKLKAFEIKELLLKRHRSSGFQLRFEPDSEIQQSRAYKKVMGDEAERQAFLEEMFFQKLYEVSEGNSKIAMIQWLRSIKEFNSFELIIQVESDLQVELPSDIDRTEFFALAFILQHDSLSIRELANAFHQSIRQTELLIARLEMMNLIQEKHGEYTVNSFAYRPIVNELKKRNMLYS